MAIAKSANMTSNLQKRSYKGNIKSIQDQGCDFIVGFFYSEHKL